MGPTTFPAETGRLLVQKLDDKNAEVWLQEMRLVLVDQKLVRTIRVAKTDEDLKWDEEDEMARAKLLFAMSAPKR